MRIRQVIEIERQREREKETARDRERGRPVSSGLTRKLAKKKKRV